MRYIYLILSLLIATNVVAQDSYDVAYYKANDFVGVNQDSAYHYFNKAEAIVLSQNDTQGRLVVLLAKLDTNGYYYDLPTFNTNLNTFDTVLKTDEAKDDEYYQYFLEAGLIHKINYFYLLGDYNRMRVYTQLLEGQLKRRPAEERDVDYYDTTLSLEMYKAAALTRSSKNELAQERYEYLLRFINKNQDSLYDAASSRIAIKRLMSKNYLVTSSFEKALPLQNEVFTYYKKRTDYLDYPNRSATALFNLIATYIETDSVSTALDLFQRVPAAFIKNPQFELRYLLLKAQIEKESGKYTASSASYQQVLDKTIAYRETDHHPDVARVYIAINELYALQKKYKEAFSALDKALLSIRKDVTIDVVSDVLDKNVYLQIAAARLALWVQDKTLIQDQAHLTTEINNLLIASDLLQPEFQNKLDKQFLSKTTFPALQDAMSLLYDYAVKSQDKKVIELAFKVSEKSKSLLLRDALQKTQAQEFANIPQETIDQGLYYEERLQRLEKERFESNNVVSQQLQDTLYQTRQAYRSHIAAIEKKYPEFYNLRYNTEVVSLTAVQKNLKKDVTLITFFEGKDALYVHTIVDDEAIFSKLPYDAFLQNAIKEFYQALKTSAVAQDRLITVVSDSILGTLPKNMFRTHLKIIPDGLLHYIPFEVLTYQGKPLYESHAISYNASVAVLNYQENKGQQRGDVVSFAPSFEGEMPLSRDRSQLKPLAHNVSEAKAVVRILGGTVYEGEEAVITRFRESVRTAKTPAIYHFATHAVANDSLPDYSYLAFTPTNGDDFLMYASELYNQDFSKAFVVLSACDTGVGKLERGEGMRSLSQGFSYAGATALLHSKWPVSDASTKELMELFYEYLAEGLPKDSALQKAKLAFVKQQEDPEFRKPYYWAGFVLAGNVESVVEGKSVYFWIVGLVILMLLLLVLRKKKQ